ncbi:MAG: hypothetical protein IKR70_03215 [Lachnospiraceae bacterium]|nr:hypothetical protein [Lachnospiraceae bacterium]
MKYTTYAKREDLKLINLPDNFAGQLFKVILMPVTANDEADMDFYSMKGAAGRPLSLDEVREERMKL